MPLLSPNKEQACSANVGPSCRPRCRRWTRVGGSRRGTRVVPRWSSACTCGRRCTSGRRVGRATRVTGTRAAGRPAVLPDQSAMSRRKRVGGFERFMAAVGERLAGGPTGALVKRVDGKPLPVAAHGTDRDAALGPRRRAGHERLQAPRGLVRPADARAVGRDPAGRRREAHGPADDPAAGRRRQPAGRRVLRRWRPARPGGPRQPPTGRPAAQARHRAGPLLPEPAPPAVHRPDRAARAAERLRAPRSAARACRSSGILPT